MSFIYRGPVPPNSNLFYGRLRELAWLRRLCRNEVQFYAIVYGGRQNGKTSLLQRFAAQPQNQTYIRTVNFQALSGVSDARMYGALAQAISNSPSSSDMPQVGDAQDLIDYFCRALHESPVKYCVLLLEELGALQDDQRLRLANTLRAMFTDRHTNYPSLVRLQIVLAGGIELYRLAATKVSTLHNICEAVYLADLDATDTIELIATGLSEVGLEREIIEQLGHSIYAHTGGHPYLTQRLGAILTAKAMDGESLNVEQVKQATHQMQVDDPLLRHLQHALGEYQLEDAGRTVLNEHIPFSRLNEEMAQLELLGLIKNVGGFWQIRNAIFANTLRSWLQPNTISPTIFLLESAPARSNKVQKEKPVSMTATTEEIDIQWKMLHIQRTIQSALRFQRANHSTSHARTDLESDIRKASLEIYTCKEALRSWGIAVDDHPDDEENVVTSTDIDIANSQILNSSIHTIKSKALQAQLDALTEEYQAICQQSVSTLNAGDKVRLQRQLEKLELDMQRIERTMQDRD